MIGRDITLISQSNQNILKCSVTLQTHYNNKLCFLADFILIEIYFSNVYYLTLSPVHTAVLCYVNVFGDCKNLVILKTVCDLGRGVVRELLRLSREVDHQLRTVADAAATTPGVVQVETDKEVTGQPVTQWESFLALQNIKLINNTITLRFKFS